VYSREKPKRGEEGNSLKELEKKGAKLFLKGRERVGKKGEKHHRRRARKNALIGFWARRQETGLEVVETKR